MSQMQQDPGPFVVELALRWGDMDSLGHLNNVQFARLFEEARVRAMDSWAERIRSSPERAAVGMVVAHQEIEFAAPLYYSREPVRCEVWISRIGDKSFDFACRLAAADGTVGALSETTLTVLDTSAGTTTAIPDAFREVLTEQVGPPAPFRRRR
ncbi:acyl-CoA thioesterase [Gordonia phosphorivorans]|uniref:Acyl-CoA thioesterase n=1 Tax=Gordonia phosphorivorans TaxID=1056982 RepID=A0ABV6H9K6_9ACTN